MGYYTLKSDELQCIFFWNAKCGCTTLKELVYLKEEKLKNFSGDIHTTIGGLNENRYFVPKEDLTCFPTYKKVLLRRDPLERLLSFYQDKVVRQEEAYFLRDCSIQIISSFSFDDFIRCLSFLQPEEYQHHLEIQLKDLEGIQFDKIIHMEKDFSRDLEEIFQIPVPQRNRSKKIQQKVSRESLAIIHRVYALDYLPDEVLQHTKK
jgi:hypothetical protein